MTLLPFRPLKGINFDAVLGEIGQAIKKDFGKGKVASYIPALKRVSPKKFGMAVSTVEGKEYCYGDAREPFSVQSIAKVLNLIVALHHEGEGLWKRVGREPSGSPYNSLVQLERENGIPRNPFINAGALVVTDAILAADPDAKANFLKLAQNLAGNKKVRYSREVAKSEKDHGHRNAAIAHFLKSHGNLKCDVDEVLDLYFHQCALAMSCADLARAFLPLANQGVDMHNNNENLIDKRRVKRVNAVMLTCGVYDNAGNYAYRVGIPCKSGVGGGIVGVVPRALTVCVWSPELDAIGNSYVGTRALELFTTKTKLSVF